MVPIKAKVFQALVEKEMVRSEISDWSFHFFIFVGTFEPFMHSSSGCCSSELCIYVCLIISEFLYTYCSIRFQLLCLRASFKFSKCTIFLFCAMLINTFFDPRGITKLPIMCPINHSLPIPGLKHWRGGNKRFLKDMPSSSYLLSASISSTN